MRLGVILSGGLCLLASPLLAQQSGTEFVGTWELVSIEAKAETGDWVPASLLTGRPVCIIMYDDKGNMAVQITTDPRGIENPPDRPGIVNGYVAYYGRYEVDAEAGTVTHHRQNHINPDLGKLSVVRHFAFSGDILTLTIAPERDLRIHWARVR